MWIRRLLQTSIRCGTNPGNDAVPSEPMKSLTDTEPEVAMQSPRGSRLEDHVIQVRVGSESGLSIGGLGGKADDETEHDEVNKEVSVDGAIGSSAGRKIINKITGELPVVVFVGLKSEWVTYALCVVTCMCHCAHACAFVNSYFPGGLSEYELYQISWIITGGHNKQNQMLLVKIAEYIGFCVYRLGPI